MSEEQTRPIPYNTVGFERLGRLTSKGYVPNYTSPRVQPDLVGIDLVHKRKKGADVPPPLTVWSDGTVATHALLWPKQYVGSDAGPPQWQKVIFSDEGEQFESFAKSVRLPTWRDRFFDPTVFESQIFTGRLIFGSMLCVICASAIKLSTYFV